jgi:hypothetical protein
VEHKSLFVRLPAGAPFDRENWYESFLGNVVLPVVATGKLHRFWFSRYGNPDGTHDAKFRFSTEHFDEVHPLVQGLIERFGLELQKEHGHEFPHDFDIVGDLSDSRFVGDNQRPIHRVSRGKLNYAFLHAGAVLVLDHLSGPDGGGYFRLEPETKSHYNVSTSVETIHHAFSNMSGIQLTFVQAEHPQYGQHWLTLPRFLNRSIAQGEPWRELTRLSVLW